MVKGLEKSAFEFEKLHGQEIYLEVERSKGCKHLCIESFKAGANYANSLNQIIAIDEEEGNELTSEIDWENRRYEIAKAAIQAIINIQNYELGWDNNILCSDAINVADELIKQLKNNEAK